MVSNLRAKEPAEASIVKAILSYLNGLPNCHARKVHGGMFSSGEPDIDAVYIPKWRQFGIPVKLEVKKPSGKTTPLQDKTIEKWRKVGAVVEVVRSVDEVREIIKRVDGERCCL